MAEILPKFITNSVWRAPNERHEEPIREELYSIERLEQYATVLAAEHKVITKPGRGRRLLPRLEENSRKLIHSYRTLVEAIRNERAVSPAAEWLVDNFHIVEDQLREIPEDLPKSYYHELPKLAAGEFVGYPRVYALAITFIAHTDSRIEAETLRRFVRAYQQVAPLSIGELWAIAITLRLALVENLQRENLSPLETAAAYQALMDGFGLSKDQLARRLGKSRAAVTNTLRLAQLPEPIQEMLTAARLSEGHARAL